MIVVLEEPRGGVPQDRHLKQQFKINDGLVRAKS